MKASVAVLLSGLLLGQSVPYVRTKTDNGSHCLRWPVSAGARGTISFVQSNVGDPILGQGAFDAVSRSAQTWETQLQACGNLDLVEGAHSASRSVGYTQGGQNENLILFRSELCPAVVPAGDPCIAALTCGNVYDCWEHGATTVALTTSSYVIASGEVLDADVEINAATATPTIVDSPPCSPGSISTSCVANDVQNAATHELGHFLGLDHSPDASSTMYASEPLGETSKRVLDSGSKQFVCDVYPSGQASRDCTSSGDGGCSSAGGTGAVGPGLLLLLAFVTRRARTAGRAGA
jgi:Matrixin